jgi:HEAT repeat protein
LQAKYNTPQRQRDLKAVAVLEEIGTPEAKQVLMRLSKGAPGVSLTVEAKAALDRLAAVKKQKVRPSQPTLEQLWTDLGSEDAAKAFRAICALTATPRQAVELLQKEVKPAPVVDEKEISALMERLSSDEFKVRERATADLGKLGEQVLPALKKALTGKLELEARRRIERLVEQAATHSSAPLLRNLRAVEVLEHAGTPEAKHVLVALAGGSPQASLTREAKASLERLVRK